MAVIDGKILDKPMDIQKDSIRIAVVVGSIVLVTLFGDLFIEGWNWGVFDFVAMGVLLFCTGLAITFAVRKITHPTYRLIAVTGIVLALLAIWTELAVGAVSQLMHFLRS